MTLSGENGPLATWDGLLAPVSGRALLEAHWGRSPLVIRGTRDKFRPLWDVERDRWMLHAERIEAVTLEDDGGQRHVAITRDRIADALSEGRTVCADVSRDPMLAPTLLGLAHELQLPGTPFAKVYVSPPDHGFALHFDSFHVLVCQLVGRKRWRFGRRPAVEAPVASGKIDPSGAAVWGAPWDGGAIVGEDGVAVATPGEDELQECTLEVGDALYLPPGTWHVARAEGRSLALSISPPRTPISQIMMKVLEEHLAEIPAFRRDVFGPLGEEAIPPEVTRDFRERLADLGGIVAGLDERALHRVWRINAAAHVAGAADVAGVGEVADVAEVAEVAKGGADGTRYRHASGAVRRYLVAPSAPGGADAIHFYAGGSEWALPIEALAFVEALAARPEIRLEEARGFDPSLDAEDVDEILGELVAAGLLVRG